jgi:hypothetical protein
MSWAVSGDFPQSVLVNAKVKDLFESTTAVSFPVRVHNLESYRYYT